MIAIRRVGKEHVLMLDISTEKSHLIDFMDESEIPILTFDSSTNCWDPDGNLQCRIRTNGYGNWFADNSFGIVTRPVSMEKPGGAFDVQADFCLKWMEMKNLEAFKK